MFDESSFPFVDISDPPSSSLDFLSELDCTTLSIGPNLLASPTGTAAPIGPIPQVVASVTPISGPPPRFDALDQQAELITPRGRRSTALWLHDGC